jgi:hypothetical protein
LNGNILISPEEKRLLVVLVAGYMVATFTLRIDANKNGKLGQRQPLKCEFILKVNTLRVSHVQSN